MTQLEIQKKKKTIVKSIEKKNFTIFVIIASSN